MPRSPFLEAVRTEIRARHYSLKTEKSYRSSLKGPLLSESGQRMVTIDGHFMVSLPKSSDSDLNVRFATFPTGSSLVPLPGQVMFLIRLTQSGFDGGESFNELAIMI